jgi:hypothetical protein
MDGGELGKIEGIEEILITTGKRLKETEKYITGVIKAYKTETGERINFERKVEFKEFGISKNIKDLLPKNLKKENVINFFYLNIGMSFHEAVFNEIEKKYGEKRAEEVGNAVFELVTKYISRNCRGMCQDNCIKNIEESGYCKICELGKEGLQCPKYGEITYEKIKATEKEMVSH